MQNPPTKSPQLTLDEWAAKDREFALTFIALQIDTESGWKASVELLTRTLAEVREQGRREQLKRDFG